MTSRGTYVLVTYARPDKHAKYQYRRSSQHPHPSSQKCTWTPCTSRALPASRSSCKADAPSPTTQNSAHSRKKPHKPSATGSSKTYCADGAHSSKSSQTTANPSSQHSGTSPRSTTSSTFESAATTLAPTE